MINAKKLNKNERASLIKKRRSKSIVDTATELKITEPIKPPTYVELLQKQHDINCIKINKEDSNIEYVKVALIEAEQIWFNVQIIIKTEYYSKMTDDEKVAIIQKEFSDFYKNFPIVSRYMICIGQYRMLAFKKMLIKCHETKKTDYEGNQQSSKDSNEKLWIMRQADYVRFLWEDIQDGKFDQAISDTVWQETHDSLTEEFSTFKTLHENAEIKVKSDDIKHRKELLYELSQRIIDGDQTMDKDAFTELMEKLLDKLYAQRFKKVIKDLSLNNVVNTEVEISSTGVGTNLYRKTEYDDELQQNFYKKTYKKMDINKLIN